MNQITILKLKAIEGKNQLRAFADVCINGEINFYGVRLMEDAKDFWVGFPQISYQSKGQTKYAPIINTSDEMKHQLREVLVTAYKECK